VCECLCLYVFISAAFRVLRKSACSDFFKSTSIRECRVEVEPCCMNGMMESIIPSLINHTPYLSSLGESFLPLVLIVPIDSFLGPIHGLIQVAHCGLLTINQSKNLYQRFTNGTYLTYSTPNLWSCLTSWAMACPSCLVL
jgi:hypothetical protein